MVDGSLDQLQQIESRIELWQTLASEQYADPGMFAIAWISLQLAHVEELADAIHQKLA